MLMNCQWQSLLCRVEAGSLNMFGEAEEKEQQSPQYTIQLRGCEVRAGPDTDRSYRIALSLLGDQVAMLEVRGRGKNTHTLKYRKKVIINVMFNNSCTVLTCFSATPDILTRDFFSPPVISAKKC